MKIAMVTGAGSGIGRAAALALLHAGYTVVLAGRRADALEQTISQAPQQSQLLAVPTDVRDEISVAALFSLTLEKLGRLDLLFNNAGVGAPQIPIDLLSLEQWNEMVSVNLTGAHTNAVYRPRLTYAIVDGGGLLGGVLHAALRSAVRRCGDCSAAGVPRFCRRHTLGRFPRGGAAIRCELLRHVRLRLSDGGNRFE